MAVDASSGAGRERPPRAVLLDALGTLVELDDPVARARARRSPRAASPVGRRRGGAAALRAEIAYYRAHHDVAATSRRSRRLRDRCAEVFRAALPGARRATPTRRAVRAALLDGPAVPRVRRGARRAARAARARARASSSSATGTSRSTACCARRGSTASSTACSRRPRRASPSPTRSSSAARSRSRAASRPATRCTSGDDLEADVGGARAAGIPRGARRPGRVARRARRACGSRERSPSCSRAPANVPRGCPPRRPGRSSRPPVIRPRRSSGPSCPPGSSRRRSARSGRRGPPGSRSSAGSPARSRARSSSASSPRRSAPSLDDPPPSVNILATVVQDLCLIGAAILMARIAATPAAVGLRPAPDARSGRAVGWIAAAARRASSSSPPLWVALIGAEQHRRDAAQGARRRRQRRRARRRRAARLRPRAARRGVLLPRLLLHRAALVARHVAGGAHHRPRLRRRSTRARRTRPSSCRSRRSARACACCTCRRGSLYPCVAAHALNNSLAFGVSQDWGWEILAADRARRSADRSRIFALVRRVSGPAPAWAG